MSTEWFGDSDGDFFSFNEIEKCRTIENAYLPPTVADKLGDKRFMIPPKGLGEKRILSADIALMRSNKHDNDATSIFINQLAPNKFGKYTNNIFYTEAFEGAHAEDQALRIQQLFHAFDCDIIVLDVKGVSISVCEYLVRDIVDPNTGEVYPALSCCNNDDIASRCKSPDAEKAIWAMNASAKINSDCALLLREGFRTGKIRLLQSEYDAEVIFSGMKGYVNMSPTEKIGVTGAYINTTMLVRELIELKHDESSGLVKISEKAGRRKDRYSSLSYNIYVSSILERDLSAPKQSFSAGDNFAMREPKIRKGRR